MDDSIFCGDLDCVECISKFEQASRRASEDKVMYNLIKVCFQNMGGLENRQYGRLKFCNEIAIGGSATILFSETELSVATFS